MALATDRQSVGKRSDFLRAQHLFNNLPGWCFSSVSQNVSQMFLGRHLWCHFSFLIEDRTHQFKFRMLILHRGSDILVPHRLHHGCQIPGLRQYPRTVIMPAAIQDQVLWKTCLRTRLRETVVPYPLNGRTSIAWTEITILRFFHPLVCAAPRTHDRSWESSFYHQPSCCPAQR